MNNENSRKIKLLKLWELLQRETDENHPMDTYEIIENLAKEGISVDRKILYSDIETLIEYGYDVSINRGKRNCYYVSSADRNFNLSEVKILLDAVQAAGSVTVKKTDELLGKIAQLAGSKKGEVLKKNIVKFGTVKSINENIYYSVSLITDAIEEKKQIGFFYFDYDIKREKSYRKDKKDTSKDKWYIVNPVATVFDNDQYYLMCYDDKHKSLINYRVDRMDKVKVLDSDITKNREVNEIDISSHKRQQFSMFGGKLERVTFYVDKKLIDVVFDKFGDNIKMVETPCSRLKCSCEVQVSPMFIAWCCSFGSRLTVEHPIKVVNSIKEHLNETLGQYEVKNDQEI